MITVYCYVCSILSKRLWMDKCREKETDVSKLLEKNQKIAFEAVKDLERSYRGVMLFYKNTESDKVRNVTIVNASPEQVRDLDNSIFIDYVAAEFKQHYDRTPRGGCGLLAGQ